MCCASSSLPLFVAMPLLQLGLGLGWHARNAVLSILSTCQPAIANRTENHFVRIRGVFGESSHSDFLIRRISSTGPPQRCTRPQPAVTMRVCPSGCVCHAVRAPGL